MIRSVLIPALCLFVLSCAKRLEPIATLQTGNATVTISAPGGKLKEGQNDIELRVQSEGNPQPVENPSLVLYMPAMGTMPAMQHRGQLESAGEGVYKGKIELQMGGTWQGLLEFGLAGEKRRAEFTARAE
jgi:hypothetical protein